MTDYRSIMLALARKQSWSHIITTLGCSRTSIDKAQRAIRTHNLSPADIEALDADQLKTLFPDNRRRNDEEFLVPDLEAIAHRRRTRRRVTMKVEHARYLAQPAASGQRHYSYKQFCKLFGSFVDQENLTVQITHVAGDEMTVDWAGTTMDVTDPLSGKRSTVYLFVATLPHSAMMFAEAFPDMRMRSWLTAHRDALEYFGGVPARVIPDHAATATHQVTAGARARDVNETYFDFGAFYGFAITPARPVKPKDKASVEKSVDTATTWIIEYLDDRQFHTLADLNEQIIVQVDFINDRAGFRGQPTSRREIFLADEAGELAGLPKQRWSWSVWRRAKAGPNYHIRINKHFYSVPWKYAGRQVDVQVFDDRLIIYADGQELATHRLRPANMRYSTCDEHVPARHKDLATKWDRERIESWAKSIGAATHTLIGQMFHRSAVEAQAYSSTLAVLSLAKQYSRPQLEQACQQILDRRELVSVKRVADEIKARDRQPAVVVEPTTPPLSTTPRPPRGSVAAAGAESSATHVRGKQAFTFTEEV